MSKLRISIVQYLNTAPLVWGFRFGAQRDKYDLSFTVPSLCADALRNGSADIAIIPAIEYQRIGGIVILPGLSISAKNQVRSLLLVSKKPIESVSRIALDRSSRSTQALTRILCAEHWKIPPDFFEAPPDLAAMLQEADAALLIGDPALRLAIAVADSASPAKDGGLICDAARAGIAHAKELHIYDIAEEWRKMTGLPAVLAVWAARRDVVTAEVIADFTASLQFGLTQIPEISKAAARELNLPAPDLASYLSWNIDYSLGGENRRGLELFYSRAAALGLIERAEPIDWAFDPAELKRSSIRA